MFARLKRHRLTILAAASLVCLALTCFLWLRSEINPDIIEFRSNRYSKPDDLRCLYFAISSHSSTFTVEFDRRRFDPAYFSALTPQETSDLHRQFPPGRHWRVDLHTYGAVTFINGREPGFRAQHHAWAPYTYFWSGWWLLSVPAWLPAALCLVLPTIWLDRRRRRRRDARAGLCPTCGYDLRASPARCPECGTPVPSPAGAPAANR